MTWFARQAALVSVTGALLAVLTATTAGQAATTGGRAAHTAPGHASTGSANTGGASTGRATPRPGGRPGRAAVSGHAAAVTAGQQAGVRRYWTRIRMEHAIPLKAGQAAAPGRPSRDGTAGRSWLSAPVAPAPVATHQPATIPAAAGGAETSPPAGGTASPSVATAPPGSAATGTQAADPPATGQPSPPAGQGDSTAPTTGSLWSSGGAVARTTGKVFFTLGRADYVCSGS